MREERNAEGMVLIPPPCMQMCWKHFQAKNSTRNRIIIMNSSRVQSEINKRSKNSKLLCFTWYHVSRISICFFFDVFRSSIPQTKYDSRCDSSSQVAMNHCESFGQFREPQSETNKKHCFQPF